MSTGQMFDPGLTRTKDAAPPPHPRGITNLLTWIPALGTLLGDKTLAEILFGERRRKRREITNTCRWIQEEQVEPEGSVTVYSLCLQNNIRQAAKCTHIPQHTFGCNPIASSPSKPARLKKKSKGWGPRCSKMITLNTQAHTYTQNNIRAFSGPH